MNNEPKSELARYAFGYSDKKPGWLFWAIHAAMLAFIIWALFASPAFACHRFSRWLYPWPQRCGLIHHASYVVAPPEPDIPLPSLEGMEFPPDCLIDWCERLKGVGLLRDKFGSD